MSVAVEELNKCMTYSPSDLRMSDRSGVARARENLSAEAFDEPSQKTVYNFLLNGVIAQTSDGKILVARHKFRVSVEEVVYNKRRDGFIAVLQEDTSRVGSGESLDDAIKELRQSLADDYEFYVSADDSRLTQDAQAYKRLLQSLLTEA